MSPPLKRTVAKCSLSRPLVAYMTSHLAHTLALPRPMAGWPLECSVGHFPGQWPDWQLPNPVDHLALVQELAQAFFQSTNRPSSTTLSSS